MKTIEQAAMEYATQDRKTRSEHAAFAAGVAFAQRWISVEEELPEANTQVLVKIECMNKEKIFEVFSLGSYDDWAKRWYILHLLIENKYHCKHWHVTHWRPIEVK